MPSDALLLASDPINTPHDTLLPPSQRLPLHGPILGCAETPQYARY